jgi:hypothetical protein
MKRVTVTALAGALAGALVLAWAVVASAADDLDAFRKKAEPVAENYFDALKARDFARLTRDFSAQMKEAVTPARLEKEIATVEKDQGEFLSAEFDRIEDQKKLISVVYRASYSKGVTTTVRFIFRKDDPEFRVQGLWEKPTPRAVPAQEVQAVRAKAGPIIEAYFAALAAKDYGAMERDFSDEMKKALPADQLQHTYETKMNGFGPFRRAEFECVSEEGAFVSVYYRMIFETEAVLHAQFVFRKADPEWKISGLWHRNKGCATE